MYSSVFGIFIKLCSHHHCDKFQHISITPQKKLDPLAVTPYLSYAPVSQNHLLLSVSMGWPILDISYLWNPITWGPFFSFLFSGAALLPGALHK